jgi:hypothetical protein
VRSRVRAEKEPVEEEREFDLRPGQRVLREVEQPADHVPSRGKGLRIGHIHHDVPDPIAHEQQLFFGSLAPASAVSQYLLDPVPVQQPSQSPRYCVALVVEEDVEQFAFDEGRHGEVQEVVAPGLAQRGVQQVPEDRSAVGSDGGKIAEDGGESLGQLSWK